MHTETFTYQQGSGWSLDAFPELDSVRTLVFVFAAPEFRLDHQPFAELAQGFPNSKIIGCSTSGEIHGASLNDASLSVAVVRFDATELRVASALVENPMDSYYAAEEIAEALKGPDLRAVFVLSDGLQFNGSELVRGFNDALGEGIVVSGGLAGDGSRFERTFVLKDGIPTEGAISAVGFYGDKIAVGHASRGGWDKFGHERVITSSSGNILFELDGKPALDVYKRYLGERAGGLPASALLFPLSVRLPYSGGKSLVRTILAVDEPSKSMTFAGDVPEGAIAQFLYANVDRLIMGAASAASELGVDSDSEVLAIGISCVGRRLVLCDRTEEEIEAALEALPSHSHLVGFYSYGEISTCPQGECDLHNQSMTLTTFQEAA